MNLQLMSTCLITERRRLLAAVRGKGNILINKELWILLKPFMNNATRKYYKISINKRLI